MKKILISILIGLNFLFASGVSAATYSIVDATIDGTAVEGMFDWDGSIISNPNVSYGAENYTFVTGVPSANGFTLTTAASWVNINQLAITFMFQTPLDGVSDNNILTQFFSGLEGCISISGPNCTLRTISNFEGGYVSPVSAVPIPAALWLLGSGLIGLVSLRRK